MNFAHFPVSSHTILHISHLLGIGREGHTAPFDERHLDRLDYANQHGEHRVQWTFVIIVSRCGWGEE